MEHLTPERIYEMFRGFGLETEQQRQEFTHLGLYTEPVANAAMQLFIRHSSSTAHEEETKNAELA